jgi:hypothetical protein
MQLHAESVEHWLNKNVIFSEDVSIYILSDTEHHTAPT